MNEIFSRFQEKLSGQAHCYCAFCKTPRRVYRKRRVSLKNILICFLASLALMFIIWQQFDPKFLVFFGLFLGAAEIFLQTRWRLSLICRECGFDPVLYLKDQNQAALKVRQRLDQRKNDPASLLKPPLNLPKIRKNSKAKASGQFVSKQV